MPGLPKKAGTTNFRIPTIYLKARSLQRVSFSLSMTSAPILPASAVLRPLIRHFIIAEQAQAAQYKVFPSAHLVVGFQYSGHISIIDGNNSQRLSTAGITGLTDKPKTFAASAGTGTVLVYFSETGLSFFTKCPASELFGQSVGLDQVFDAQKVCILEEKLGNASDTAERIRVVEQFFLSLLRDIQQDSLILEAVKRIYCANGNIRINELQEQLFISARAFEKRFKKLVGISPKKFATIVRFNQVLGDLNTGKSLTEICYENNFFDQAHFIHSFKQFTGESPGQLEQGNK